MCGCKETEQAKKVEVFSQIETRLPTIVIDHKDNITKSRLDSLEARITILENTMRVWENKVLKNRP
jgi:hypothetical protein